MIQFLLLCWLWRDLIAVAGANIRCGQTVTGWYNGNGEEVIYRFTSNSFSSIHPTTCGLSWWDTRLEVRTTSATLASVTKLDSHKPSEVLASSDDLGPIVCPVHPEASAVSVKVDAGVMYDVVLRGGSNYAALQGNATVPLALPYSLHLFCSEPLESYWSHVFAEVGFLDDHLLSVFNGVWYYNHTATCVGKGQFYGLCPFHFLHCAGRLTYGWAVLQAEAVVFAIAQPGHRYSNRTCSMADMPCTQSEYTCMNMQCIRSESLCDGRNDCLDGQPSASEGGDGATPVVPPSSDEDPDLCVSEEFGCTDDSALNYNPLANVSDGTCYYCWWDAPVSFDLMTDDVPVLIEKECGVVGTNLKLAVRASQQYEVTQISLLVPSTNEHVFLSEFVDQGRVSGESVSTWNVSDHSEFQCWNDYAATIPWSALTVGDGTDDSILTRFEYPGQIVLVGYIHVASMEKSDNVHNTATARWLHSTVPFYLVYRTKVMTQFSPDMVARDFDSPEIKTAFADVWVMEQDVVFDHVSPSSPQVKAQILILTMVERPLALRPLSIHVDSPWLQTAQANLTLSMVDDCDADDTEDGVDICSQQFLVDVNMMDSCSFSGTYTATFSVVCTEEDPPNACQLPEDAIDTITFHVESESVCPEVLQEVVAVGSSAAYHEPRHGMHPREDDNAIDGDAFFVDDWVYFEIALSSLDGLIVETSIDSIDLCFDIECSQPWRIYHRALALAGIELAPDIQLVVLDYPRGTDGVDSPLPNISDIHMYLSPEVFNVSSNEMTLAFQLRVQVNILYYHTNFVLDWLSLPAEDADTQAHRTDVKLKGRRGLAKDHRLHLLRLLSSDKSLDAVRDSVDFQQLLEYTSPDLEPLSVHINQEITSPSAESFLPTKAKAPSSGEQDAEATESVVIINNHSDKFLYIVIAILAVVVVALIIFLCLRRKRTAAAAEASASGEDGNVNRVLDFLDEEAHSEVLQQSQAREQIPSVQPTKNT